MKNILLAFAIASAAFVAGQHTKQDEIDRLQLTMDEVFKHWDQKVGGTKMVEGADSYNLRTFDSGKNWYAVKYDEDFGMSIIGEAEDVFPDLLAHLNDFDKLVSYVEQNGPITLKDGVEGEEAKLLQNFGFQVTKKTKVE